MANSNDGLITMNKEPIKKILGELPFTAELYWRLYQSGRPLRGFKLDRLEKVLPELVKQAEASAYRELSGRKVLIFSASPKWIAHTTVLGLALSGLGHHVTLAYAPFRTWHKPIPRFDLRRYNQYVNKVLAKASPLLHCVSWLGGSRAGLLPSDLHSAIEELSILDTQYFYQTEEIDQAGELYQLRLERNTNVAKKALTWMKKNRPDVVIIPNGTILEMGAVYQVARYLNLSTVTYEFDEQRQHTWMAQNAEVMLQDTDTLWNSRKNRQLSPSQVQQVQSLITARKQARLWKDYSRKWQNLPSQGSNRVRKALGLDDRPVVLVAPNVLGDSVTLKRQVFSQSMTDWLDGTVRFFADRPEVQLVVRIHPGESLLLPHGVSMAEIIRCALSKMPDHIHLIGADADINTYDLIEVADLGVVYTSTVGLEMAMRGLPVIVCGRTHYRGKGFTLDPDTWDEYYELIERVMSNPARYFLSEERRELSWHYAYFFFFEYPLPFPWHFSYLWDDLSEWPLKRVLSQEGLDKFGNTFRYFTGDPIER
jgi:hypothetical protein